MALALGAPPAVQAAVSHPDGPGGGTASNVPYSLPVQLPSGKTSPAVDPNAPYTPLVLNLIHQLEPDSPPTAAELTNASLLLHDGGNGSCHNVGPLSAPTGTTPSIAPLCWTDAQGVLNTSGPNARGSTAPMTLMGLGASFDPALGNAWGQTEGSEARDFMVTGIFGPQTDLDRIPTWGRNLTTTGEDPYLSSQMVASQINGMQGVGAMSQMKHFAVYNGQSQSTNTTIQDQALHEQYLTPYEGGFVDGQAAAAMCSYQVFQDTSTNLPPSVDALYKPSPYASGPDPQTWPLNESHYACEQPLTLNYALRDLFHSVAMVGSDYPATHSTAGIVQGETQEMPTQAGFFSASNTLSASQQTDPTGDTCADTAGNAEPCSTAGAVHVGGIPGPGCPAYGCTLVNAVLNGTVPLSIFNQAVAEVLYQQQRFGLLGCSDTPVSSLCTNPGGIGADKTGTAPLPTGTTSGTPQLGTKDGDAAIVEKYSEEGATLLKNDDQSLPLTKSDLNGGILVTGPGAQHTIADPTNEASTGFIDRDAINPLQQLEALSGKPGAFTYVPANDPVGQTVPASALSTSSTSVTGSLSRTTGPNSPSDDATIDFTTTSQGQLAPGSYTWSGYVYVPTTDAYTFELQQSSGVANANVTFSLDGTSRTLATAATVYGATVPGSPTNAGYTEPLLTNRQFAAGTLTGGSYHPVTITFNNDTTTPASFRFAYSRANGDIDDAAAAAKGKKAAVVFLNDSGASTTIPNPYGSTPATITGVASLSAANTNLVNAVAEANPNTIVVLNTTNPVLTPWIGNVKSVLEMWFSGQEGGTSTARLLLGQANPSGHTPLTWPANATDTLWGYNQTTPLYSGDTTGPHLERLNGGAGGTTNETEGIYSGYRYFDQENITPQFPFGYGLSYSSFKYSHLKVTPTTGGGATASFDITNTGKVAGSDVAQVYLGAGPAVSGVQQAVRSLRGFDRVTLNPGQTQHENIQLDQRSFQYWSDPKQQWVTDYGTREVRVGDADSLASLPLSGTVTINPTPSIDKTVSVNGANTVTARIAPANPGDLLVAFVAADGPSGKTQSATVSGGDLHWTLAKRENTQYGDSEIWTARAPDSAGPVSVTSSLARTGYRQQLAVTAFASATGVGAVAGASAGRGAPSITLTTAGADSWVFAVGNDWDRSVPRTPAPGQTIRAQSTDSVGDTYWVQSPDGVTPDAGTKVRINDTGPNNDRWNLAAIEIQ
ncbi:hypothetical protein GCM10023322_29790 [Rugosimonospora acidiphila]|uniref:PA14 domain-containing protein n=1 Tax=Rugosimonospora acidiphila TaxID=556531 RepID=A0ABP9RSH2_9ACTN